MREREDLVFKIREKIKELMKKYSSVHNDWAVVKTLLREDLSEFLYQETQRRPMVIPVVIEV